MIRTSAENSSTQQLNGAAIKRRVGLISPWNQACGLATYAQALFGALESELVAIFAEWGCELVSQDEAQVQRCWSRNQAASGDYSELERQIERADLDILYINCHPSFFAQPSFANVIGRAQSRNIKVVVHVHQLFTLSQDSSALLNAADRVIVHFNETRLEAIAHGADPERVVVMPHGVSFREDIHTQSRTSLRGRLGIEHDGPIVTGFGFIQPHKGMESIIQAVQHLRSRGIPARGLIVGRAREDQSSSAQYLQALRDLVRANNLDPHITFISEYVSDQRVAEYLAASDLVVMNYGSNYFEASGACSQALGVGAVVMASLSPAMMAFGDSVWHITGGYPVTLSAELLLNNRVLYDQIKLNALDYAKRNSWPYIAQRLEAIFQELGVARDRSQPIVMNLSGAKPRILMQSRPGTFSHRGGDTVVLERLNQGLVDRGWSVKVDVSGTEDPSGYDLVHLFNFAMPELTQRFAERAKAAGVPFVVTTLYEDLPSFLHQSHAVAIWLMEYVQRGQDSKWWNANQIDLQRINKAKRLPVDWLVENAAALFTNGAGETKALERDLPRISGVSEIRLGHEVGALVGPELFQRTYGIKDFVLCVGRIESRKNQLMLLKALENSDLTLVLAAGGFSYQPEYEAAVRAFRRKGRTLILDRLDPEMLSSAYAACRIHVLPSWYELPGLVSLEAAAHGKNVVVTKVGTSSDYFGDKAFYCQPWNPESIHAAITCAFYAPVKEGLVDMVKQYTWDKAVEETISTYGRVVQGESIVTNPQPTTQLGGCYDMSIDAQQLETLVTTGEQAARDGCYQEAERILRQAETIAPTSVQVLKALGAVLLAQGRIDDAIKSFEVALQVEPAEPNLLSGRGMCAVIQGEIAVAMALFERVLAEKPDHLVAIHQMLDCAYKSNTFNRAEAALRRYLAINPQDVAIRFCLAGVMFKQGDIGAADSELERIINERPDYQPARELREMIMQDSVAQTSMQIEQALITVDNLRRDGQVVEAREKLESVRRNKGISDEQSQRFNCIEAEIYLAENELSLAEEMYDRVLATNPNSSRALCGKGALLAERQDWIGARDYFERARANDSKCDVAVAGLGLWAMVNSDPEQAFELFSQAVAMNPENQRALLGVVQLGYPLRRFSQIERAIDAFLQMHPANLEMLYSLAGVLYAQGKVEQAKLEIEKILVFEPQHTNALELRELISEKRGSQGIVS